MVKNLNGELVEALDVPEFYRMLFGDMVMVYAHSKERPDLCFVFKTADDSRDGKMIESAIKRYSFFEKRVFAAGANGGATRYLRHWKLKYTSDQRTSRLQCPCLEARAFFCARNERRNKGAMTMQAFIDKWQGTEFESSTELTDQFTEFAKNFKNALATEVRDDLRLTFHRGHFEVSGFLQNKDTGQWAYWFVFDVRFSPDEWVDRVVIRTATDDHDYTGGSNQFTSLADLHDAARRLTT